MLRPIYENNNLWQNFKAGNKDAFQQIYDENFQALVEYGVRLSQNKELIEDAIHDLFVKIFNNRNNLGDLKNIRAYLFVSLRSNFLNKIARENKVVATEFDEHFPFNLNFSIENEYLDKESNAQQVKTIVESLNKLSPRQREIIYLQYYQELNYDEIADILGITVKACYKLNARALEAMKNLLSLLVYLNLNIYLENVRLNN